MPFIAISPYQELYYVLRAPQGAASSGLTFLFIHGLGSSSSCYATVMPALVAAGHQCLAFDMNGLY
jgi:pimeloyl-ACP methyl ester carboxylesterase